MLLLLTILYLSSLSEPCHSDHAYIPIFKLRLQFSRILSTQFLCILLQFSDSLCKIARFILIEIIIFSFPVQTSSTDLSFSNKFWFHSGQKNYRFLYVKRFAISEKTVSEKTVLDDRNAWYVKQKREKITLITQKNHKEQGK